jgi:Ulp1 family protease
MKKEPLLPKPNQLDLLKAQVLEDFKSLNLTKSTEHLQASSLQRLWPPRWLNDEVINTYFQLLNASTTRSFCLNTFFFEMCKTESSVKLKRILKR